MTAAARFQPPQRVRDNAQRRALARRPQPCGAGVSQGRECLTYPAVLFPAGYRCQAHRPDGAGA